MNTVSLVGRLTKDPELRYIPGSGTAVTDITIAVDRDYYKKDGTKDTDFIPIQIMGKPAEYVASYMAKGTLISVIGSIQIDRYEDKEGNKKTFTKVKAKQVHFLYKSNGSNTNNSNSGTVNNNFNDGSFDPSFEPMDDNEIPF